jgi:pimeloyl-ACP methyl ester carboxylesterase
LVHGHWHGSWCWDRLVEQIQGSGHHCLAIDLPCTLRESGTDENARVVLEALRDAGSDVILVGHSAGGLTIPLVANRRAIRHLVFIAALLPVPGKSLAEQFEDEPEMIDPRFEFIDDGDGFCSIDPARAANFFYNDCSSVDANWAIARLRRQTTLTITERTPLNRWPDTPKSYIIGDDDRVVRPSWAVRAARQRLGVEPMVMPGAGHSPFLSQPQQMANHLLAISEQPSSVQGIRAS